MSETESVRDGYYLDDLVVGQTFTSPKHEIDEAQIIAFAQLYDPQPFHTDVDAAKDTLFEGLAASGWQTAALTMELLRRGELKVFGGNIGAGVDVQWPRATRPGDILEVEATIVEIKPSKSRPERGIATLRCETRNQRGEVLAILVAKLVMPRRAGGVR